MPAQEKKIQIKIKFHSQPAYPIFGGNVTETKIFFFFLALEHLDPVAVDKPLEQTLEAVQ